MTWAHTCYFCEDNNNPVGSDCWNQTAKVAKIVNCTKPCYVSGLSTILHLVKHNSFHFAVVSNCTKFLSPVKSMYLWYEIGRGRGKGRLRFTYMYLGLLICTYSEPHCLHNSRVHIGHLGEFLPGPEVNEAFVLVKMLHLNSPSPPRMLGWVPVSCPLSWGSCLWGRFLWPVWTVSSNGWMDRMAVWMNYWKQEWVG